MVLGDVAVEDALSVEGLSVRYGGFEAVSGLSFRLVKGTVTGLIGPNGAGKTSVYNAICGWAPATGALRVNGTAVPLGTPDAVWRAGIARTFQRLELFWTLTVEAHIRLARRRALKLGRRVPEIDEVLDCVGLRELRDASVSVLPIGTCRLVEFGRALATGADVLLLDEPSSGLDRRETEQFEAIVRRVCLSRGLTVLLVEHDLEFVLSVTDRILVLDFGRLIADETPDTIQDNARVRQVYLGTRSEVRPTRVSG